MKYEMQKQELTLEINGSPVKVTFESNTPEVRAIPQNGFVNVSH